MDPDEQASTAPESRERGAGLVEYTLIIALIALACVAGVTQFGQAIRDSDMKSISTSI